MTPLHPSEKTDFAFSTRTEFKTALDHLIKICNQLEQKEMSTRILRSHKPLGFDGTRAIHVLNTGLEKGWIEQSDLKGISKIAKQLGIIPKEVKNVTKEELRDLIAKKIASSKNENKTPTWLKVAGVAALTLLIGGLLIGAASYAFPGLKTHFPLGQQSLIHHGIVGYHSAFMENVHINQCDLSLPLCQKVEALRGRAVIEESHSKTKIKDPKNGEIVAIVKMQPFHHVFMEDLATKDWGFNKDYATALLDKDFFFGVPRIVDSDVRAYNGYPGAYSYAIEYIPHETIRFEEFTNQHGEKLKVAIADEIAQKLPPLEVQKAALLAMLIGAIDQHGSNILLNESHLVPIDHDEAFPSFDVFHYVTNKIQASFPTNIDRYNSPFWKFPGTFQKQLKQTPVEEIKDYLAKYDPEQVVDDFRKHQLNFKDSHAYALFVFGTYLKVAVSKGFSLWDCYEYRNKQLDLDVITVLQELQERLDEFKVRKYVFFDTYDRTKIAAAFRQRFREVVENRFEIRTNQFS